MRKNLFYKYTGNYYIPIKLHINCLISSLLAAGYRDRTAILTVPVQGVAQRRRCGMHAMYQDGLRRVFTRNLSVNLREGRGFLIEHLGLHDGTLLDDFSTEQAIRSKFSAHKASLQRERV